MIIVYIGTSESFLRCARRGNFYVSHYETVYTSTQFFVSPCPADGGRTIFLQQFSESQQWVKISCQRVARIAYRSNKYTPIYGYHAIFNFASRGQLWSFIALRAADKIKMILFVFALYCVRVKCLGPKFAYSLSKQNCHFARFSGSSISHDF